MINWLREWWGRRLDGVRSAVSADLIVENEELQELNDQLQGDLDVANGRVEDRDNTIGIQRRRIVDLEEQVSVVDPIANGLDNQRHFAAQQRIKELEVEVDKLRRICRGD